MFPDPGQYSTLLDPRDKWHLHFFWAGGHSSGVHSVPGGGKKVILASLEGFVIDKVLFAEIYDTYQTAKRKLGQKLHFQAFYGLLKLENAWLTLE